MSAHRLVSGRDTSADRIQASIARLIRLRREGRVPVGVTSGGATGEPGVAAAYGLGVSGRAPGRGDLLDLPGAELRRAGGGEVMVIRRPVAELLPDSDVAGELRKALERLSQAAEPDPGLAPAAGHRLEDLVVLDLETTGFWGCPIFLVGLLLVDGGEFVSLQILARDYPEEPPMLAAAAEILAGRGLLVTFNGKSYDVPCLRDRCVVHRVEPVADTLAHVDILHPARRRWGGELPDCRLQTLEKSIVGLHRTGDVPSAEIPGVYHAFTAAGDPEPLLPVLHHGRIDVLTTARVFARLAGPAPRH